MYVKWIRGFVAALPLLLAAGSPGRAQDKPARPAVPDDVVFEPDIEYANPDGQHLKLDMARPKTGQGPFPAVVCIHGGGFRAGSRQGYDGLCVRLAQQGFVALTVSYRLAPRYPFPAAVLDVKAAVRWLRANARKYQVNPERIGATGTSAGGHLALFLGVTVGVKRFEGDAGNPGQSSRVAAVVSFAGPTDFTRSYGKSKDAAEVLPLFLGGNLEKARQRHILASPLSWVTPEAAPTLCVHGTKDDYVAYQQATWIVDRLKAAGVEARLLTLEGAGHGFKGKDAERAERALVAFFNKHLKRRVYVLHSGVHTVWSAGDKNLAARNLRAGLIRRGVRPEDIVVLENPYPRYTEDPDFRKTAAMLVKSALPSSEVSRAAYVRMHKALEDAGVTPAAELIWIGHSAGGQMGFTMCHLASALKTYGLDKAAPTYRFFMVIALGTPVGSSPLPSGVRVRHYYSPGDAVVAQACPLLNWCIGQLDLSAEPVRFGIMPPRLTRRDKVRVFLDVEHGNWDVDGRVLDRIVAETDPEDRPRWPDGWMSWLGQFLRAMDEGCNISMEGLLRLHP